MLYQLSYRPKAFTRKREGSMELFHHIKHPRGLSL